MYHSFIPGSGSIVEVMKNNSLDSYVFIAPEIID